MFINELIVILILLLIFFVRQQIHSFILQPLYWNQTTFRPYQDDSLIFEVRLGDVMDLICPFYDEQNSYMVNELEQYDIYRVTKNEYDQCRIDQFQLNPLTRIVITCNSPYDVMKYTLNFRSYLPIPNGLEFHSNETYYFLSTSTSQQPQCFKLKIIVHDYQRFTPSSSTVSPMNKQEQKPLLFSRYSHPQQGPSSIDKSTEYDDDADDNDYNLLPHVVKAQRQSDPYSIKWITEAPHRMRDSNKSHRTPNSLYTSILPSNTLSLALNSSSPNLFISLITILLLLVLSLT